MARPFFNPPPNLGIIRNKEECTREFNNWNPRCLNKIKVFLEKDASIINETSPLYTIPALRFIFVTFRKCPFELAKLLLSHGANPNVHGYVCPWNDFWRSPLQEAVLFEHGFDICQLLLFSGARFGATSEFKKNNPILVAALRNFLVDRSHKKLEELKLLVKHFLLEDPDFEIELFIQRNTNGQCPLLEELASFANECSHQVKVMKVKYISLNSSLFYFVKRRLSPRIAASGNRLPMSNEEFNRLINIMAECLADVSHYVELIVHVVGMSTMIEKLHELQVYTVRNDSALNETTNLNFDCLLNIARLLSAVDMLGLFIAYAPNDEYKGTNGTQYSVKKSNKRQKLL